MLEPPELSTRTVTLERLVTLNERRVTALLAGTMPPGEVADLRCSLNGALAAAVVP